MFSSNASQVSNDANYIEDVFSTYLYTGNGSTQTITNGIDLAGEGGMVWLKCRNSAENNEVYDTARGANLRLITNTTGAQVDRASSMSFNSNGISWVGDNISNTNGNTYASWTFRKQPKFFDVVTYTGNGSGSDQVISHNLGSTPGCVIVKATNASQDWLVWHRATNNPNDKLFLNKTDAVLSGYGNGVQSVTSTSFIAAGNGTENYDININGRTYVAYLFAHNAGGFGLTGTDNVISCGSVLGGAEVNLGYEPQWVLAKASGLAANWFILDTMRGFTGDTGGSAQVLRPNESSAESTNNRGYITSTGFVIKEVNGADYIYIAIRRGPMKTPTSGTSVFSPTVGTDATNLSSGFPVDMFFDAVRTGNADNTVIGTRLIGTSGALVTSKTAAEASGYINAACFQSNTTYRPSIFGSANGLQYSLGRAPSFMDVCCYTGTGSARTVAHNLAAVPELMIVKSRSTVNSWPVWNPDVFAIDNAYITLLNSTIAVSNSGTSFNSTAPTSTVFTVGTNANTNGSGVTYVAYLFSSCPGVSKVGSYTGTGTTQQINCGFTGGARFVLIKRIASAGGAPAGADWYVWDSARGIVAGNDPYLLLNSTAAEVTSTDYVDTYSAGFEISSTAPAEINASGGTFIYLAIA